MDALHILITGASGGIGEATALRLAQPSPRYTVKTLVLHYNSNASKTERITHEIGQLNPAIKVSWLQADLGSADEVDRLHRDAVAAAGAPINVLFANAGTTAGHSGPTGTLEAVPPEVFEQTWRVNTLSVYQLTRLVAPGMTSQNFGRVIYNSSVAGLTGGVVGAHYATSKSALHGMLHYLSPRLAASGVTLNAVAPALIEGTTMLPEGNKELEAKIPVGRLGRPDEIAGVVCLMVENGGMVVAMVIHLDNLPS
ncbi:3-ketoacyl-acyl carrier protein [Diaporthe eres]|nr:3-ketoacyl-acyl carrier protein [Diaporthe eres]